MNIIQAVKNYLIPNLQNSFHPYLLRTPALATVAACLLFSQIIVNVASHSPQIFGMQVRIEAEELVEMTNQVRGEEGVASLSVDSRLEQAAQAKAQDMIDRDYWSHFAPDGTSPWSFIEAESYPYRFAGENLAKSFQTSEGVMQGWLQSPDHRDNLLDPRFSQVGIAMAHGMLQGEQTTVVVAMYATPQPVSISLGESPIQSAQVAPNPPPPAQETTYSLVNPLLSFAVLPTVSQIAVVIAFGFGALFSLQHIVVTRKRLLWDEHVHPRPLLQGVVMVGMAIFLLQTGFGVVG